MNRRGTDHSYRTRCCLKDWREGVSDGETCTTVFTLVFVMLRSKTVFLV